MSAVVSMDAWRSQFEALPAGEPAWLAARRAQAFARFREQGFPAPPLEDWKYTRVLAVEQRAFETPAELCIGLTEDDIAPFLPEGLGAWRLVFVNGRFMPMLSTGRSALPTGFTLTSLARAMEGHATRVEPLLGALAGTGRNGFTALNLALFRDGAFVHLPAGARAERPIHLLFLAVGGGDGLLAQPRNLVVAGEGAEATIIECHAALGDTSHLANTVTEIALGDGASIAHSILQDQPLKATQVTTVAVRQGRDSRYRSHAVSLGALLHRCDIDVSLDAQGAECSLDGLYVGAGRQHVDFHTRIDHRAAHGTSREFYKGVLDGRARGVFNGKVHVHPHAQKTDAAQSNANLLLSPHAEADTKPELEIYADDVKCSHGATVGQLDETAVFYLRARGIGEAEARALLTAAFAGEVIDRAAGPESWRSYLHTRLAPRLGGGTAG